MKIITMVLAFAFLAAAIAAESLPSSEKLAPIQAISLNTAWAGAIVGPAPPQTSFYAITGSFAAPNPMPPRDISNSTVWQGSAWMGIDGVGAEEPALVQAGIMWRVDKNGDGSLSTYYNAWYEWLPDLAKEFSNFSVSAGDIITVSIQSTNSTSTKCSIENHRTGVVVWEDMAAPAKASLVGGHAEWIVEDFLQAS